MKIPAAFYRVSMKALILNEDKEFLLAKEASGFWDLLGGGLDFGEDPTEGLVREITEETGLKGIHSSDAPSYFLTVQSHSGMWIANIIYAVTLEDLDFKASDECTELGYFTKDSIKEVEVLPNVTKFAELYTPSNHTYPKK